MGIFKSTEDKIKLKRAEQMKEMFAMLAIKSGGELKINVKEFVGRRVTANYALGTDGIFRVEACDSTDWTEKQRREYLDTDMTLTQARFKFGG